MNIAFGPIPAHRRRAALALAVFALIASGSNALAAELVMVERAGCVYCRQWDRDIAPIYMKSDEGQRAPLRRISLDIGAPPMELAEPVIYTPTFLLVDNNREIGRIVGYRDDLSFWSLLTMLFAKLPPQNSTSSH